MTNPLTTKERALRSAVGEWCRKVIAAEKQSSVAKATGYSQPTLSRITNGRDLPSLGVILAFHRHYGEKHSAPEEVLAIVRREGNPPSRETAARPAPIRPAVAPTPPPTASESIASVLARVERKLVAGSASSREAAQRVVDCAQRYAAVVEQAHAHKLLVFLGDATGEGPSIQSAALKLYDALLGVPELAELLAQPARPQQHAESAPQPAPVVEPPAVDPYEVVVTRKQPPPPLVVDEPEEPQVSYPSLAKASQRNPLLIVGGVAIPEVRERLSNLGVQHEWIETRGSIGQNRVDAAALRIRRTNACAAMVLHGFVGHKTFDRVREAARLGIVPFIAPQKAGTAELVRALHTLDKQIANGVTQ